MSPAVQGPRSRRPDSEKTLLWLAREDAGLTRSQVAALVQPPVASKTIERWETGETPVSHQRMRQLALIYRVSLGRLAQAV